MPSFDNPLGTRAAGSLAALAIGFAPQTPPCGLPMPGYGMAGGGSPGELLVDPASTGWVQFGGPRLGPLQPVDFVLHVPADRDSTGLRCMRRGWCST